MKNLILYAIVAVSLAGRAFAYGHEGHQAIAEIARSHLTPETRNAITQILGSDDLPSIATWLDDVRAAGRNRGSLKGDAGAEDFKHRFPRSDNWHFTNACVGADHYDAGSQFASANDIVHAIGFAINTLEGANTGMSQIEALKVLVHLVGDIHQPLHCVSGYYDLSNPATPRLLGPDEATMASPSDAGGNDLYFTKAYNLHEAFDTLMPEHVAHSPEFHVLASLAVRAESERHEVSAGDYHSWPTLWATESICLGSAAYSGLIFDAAQVSTGREGRLRIYRIDVRPPANYGNIEAAVVEREIGEAGLRLADLLNSIRWSAPGS